MTFVSPAARASSQGSRGTDWAALHPGPTLASACSKRKNLTSCRLRVAAVPPGYDEKEPLAQDLKRTREGDILVEMVCLGG